MNNLLVFLCDENYAKGTTAAIQSARDNGHWTGEIACIVGDTVQENDIDLLVRMGVHIRSRSDAGAKALDSSLNLPFSYHKLLIFLDPFFRQFDRLLYFDSDVLIINPIEEMASQDFPPGKSIGFRSNPGKGDDWYALEINNPPEEFVAKYPNHNQPAASCCFLVAMQAAPTIAESREGFTQILSRYQDLFRHFDQGMLATFFYHDQFLLEQTSVYNPTAREINELRFSKDKVFLHTCDYNAPMFPTSDYHVAFQRYYQRAVEAGSPEAVRAPNTASLVAPD